MSRKRRTGRVLIAKKYCRVCAVNDIVAWNQLGCLSPHVIYVEHGGALGAEQFAEMLAQELAKREESEPRGELPTESAAVIASKRESSTQSAPPIRLDTTPHWCSVNSTAWTVIYEADPRFQLSCQNRFIYVKARNRFQPIAPQGSRRQYVEKFRPLVWRQPKNARPPSPNSSRAGASRGLALSAGCRSPASLGVTMDAHRSPDLVTWTDLGTLKL